MRFYRLAGNLPASIFNVVQASRLFYFPEYADLQIGSMEFQSPTGTLATCRHPSLMWYRRPACSKFPWERWQPAGIHL